MLGPNQGINSVAGTVVTCQTSNCLDCKANYQVCVACDTVSGFYLQGSTCKNQASLGANEGIDSVAGTVVACQASNCLNCKANYQVCTACQTGSGFYLQGSVCKNQAGLGANEGINSAAGTVVSCLDSNCVNCKANYQICMACQTVSGFYLQGSTCKNQASFGTNEGIDSAAGTVVPCVTSNCVNCKANYQTCTVCNTGAGFYLQGAVCKNQASLGANQGINSAAGTVVPCSTSNCLDCKANYQACTVCDTASGFYLQGSVCQALPNTGPTVANQTVISPSLACKVSNCRTCTPNPETCIDYQAQTLTQAPAAAEPTNGTIRLVNWTFLKPCFEASRS